MSASKMAHFWTTVSRMYHIEAHGTHEHAHLHLVWAPLVAPSSGFCALLGQAFVVTLRCTKYYIHVLASCLFLFCLIHTVAFINMNQIHMGTGRTWKTPSRWCPQSSGSNWGTWSCEAARLHTAPPRLCIAHTTLVYITPSIYSFYAVQCWYRSRGSVNVNIKH